MSYNNSWQDPNHQDDDDRQNDRIVFDYNHRKRKAPTPPQSGSDTDDEGLNLDQRHRPVAAVAVDDDDDDIEIIEIIEAPHQPPKKIAPPAPALSKILKKEREEQEEVEEKTLKFKQYVSERKFRKKKKIPPPPPVLSNYLEQERAQEERMLKYKKFLSQKFPDRDKLSPDEEERLRNLDPNKMYLNQYEKYCSTSFKEDTTSKNKYKKDKPRNETDSGSTTTSKESLSDDDDSLVSNTTNDIKKMIVPNPKFNSKNNKNPTISANATSKTATHTTARKQYGTGDQYKEDYDFLLNGIPNGLQYRISEYAAFKSNNPRLSKQDPTEGFLFLKEKQVQDIRQNHTEDNKGSRSSISISRSRYFGLSKDTAIPAPIPKSNNVQTISKDTFFDTGNNNNKTRKLSGRKRCSSPSLLDITAQNAVSRYLPVISSRSRSTYILPLPASNNSKEITPSIIERPPSPNPSLLPSPVEENVDERQAADETISRSLSPLKDKEDFENVFLQIPLIRMPTPTPTVESTEGESSPISPDKFDFENDFDIYKEKDKPNSDLESEAEDVNASITINPYPFERIILHPPSPANSDSDIFLEDISLSEEVEIKINPFDISTTTEESSLEKYSGSVNSEIESDGDESFVYPITIRSDIFESEESLSSCSYEVDEYQQHQEIGQLTSPSASNGKDQFYNDKSVFLSIINPVKIIPTSSKNAQFALNLENNPETLRTIQNLLNGSRVVLQELNVPTSSNTDNFNGNPFQFLGGILNEKTFSNANVDTDTTNTN